MCQRQTLQDFFPVLKVYVQIRTLFCYRFVSNYFSVCPQVTNYIQHTWTVADTGYSRGRDQHCIASSALVRLEAACDPARAHNLSRHMG